MGQGQYDGNRSAAVETSDVDNPPMHVGDSLFNLYDQMLGDVELPDVLRQVAEVVCSELNAERATVYLIDEDTRDLVSVAMVGNVASTIRIPMSETSLAGYCAANGRAFVVGDAYGDLAAIDAKLRFDRSWDEANNFRTRDVMCAPAEFKGDLVGVVQVVNSKSQPFGEADLPLLRNVARLIGYALYHAKLYDDIAGMKKLDKDKADFMRIMVHELKSPVAASRMLAAAMGQSFDDPKATHMTERIVARMDEMISLIEDVLQLAKVKAGGALGEVTVLDLADETRAHCEPYHEQATQKGLEMKIDLPGDPVHVRFDEQGLRLVLSNLVSNAVKYTKEGRVKVRLRREQTTAVLEVSDTGIGIPEADVPKLFREFYRASNVKKHGIKGSGVGLAGVKNMVERFGGKMTLQTRENEGSTFIVHFPLCEGQ